MKQLVLLIWIQLLKMGLPKELDCLDRVKMPSLVQEYSSQLGSDVLKIDAQIITNDPEFCEVSQYDIHGLTEGILIDEYGMITVDTSVVMETKYLQIVARLGIQEVIIKNIKLEVYDCLKNVSFDWLKSTYKVQLDEPFEINRLNSILFSVHQDCKIDSFKIPGKTPAINLDEVTGKIIVDTSQTMQASFYYVLKIGSQSYTSKSFSLEIYDCTPAITLPQMRDMYSFQMNQTFAKIDFQVESTQDDCQITRYELVGNNTGAKIDAITGRISVNTSAAVDKMPLKISVQVGSQNYQSQEFQFEIYDCYSSVVFINQDLKFQLNSDTQVMRSMKSYKRPECKPTSFRMGNNSVTGVSIDRVFGELTVEASTPFDQLIQVSAIVGAQIVTSPPISIEVYDCLVGMTFVKSLSIQQDKSTKKFTGIQTWPDNKECGGYKFSLNQQLSGVKINEQTSEISVDTSTAMDKTLIEARVEIGGKQVTTFQLEIEVYDCSKGIGAADDLKVQIGSPQQQFSVLKEYPEHPSCQNINYAITRPQNGIQMSKEGLIIVDAMNQIEKTDLEVILTIGSLRTAIKIKIEVYDCESILQFAQNIRSQINSQPQWQSVLALNKDTDYCIISSYEGLNDPKGSSFDVKSGKVTLQTDEIFVQSLELKVQVGLQVIFSTITLEVYDCTPLVNFAPYQKIQQNSPVLKFKVLPEDTTSQGCIGSQYLLKELVDGVQMDQSSGVITVQTKKSMPQTTLNVSVLVGSQFYESNITIMIFDCRPSVTLPFIREIYSFQKDQNVDPIPFESVSIQDACKINRQSIQEQVGLNRRIAGISIDSSKGQMLVDTNNPIDLNRVKLVLYVGSQKIESKPFKIEIYDCNQAISFPKLESSYKFQINTPTQQLDIDPIVKRPECKVLKYEFAALPEGVDANSNSGKLLINTINPFKDTQIKFTMMVGFQTIQSPFLKVEVYDCQQVIQFARSQTFQIGETIKAIGIIQKTSDYCDQVTIRMDNIQALPTGIAIDLQSGNIVIQTDGEIPTTRIQVNVEVGTQIFFSPLIAFEVYDCKKFIQKPRFLSTYSFQVNYTIPEFDAQFISASPKCQIDSQRLSDQIEGVKLNQKTGRIVIANEKAIKPIQMKVLAQVGSQLFASEPFYIKVYDCSKHITFQTDQIFQVNSTNKIFRSVKANDNSQDCRVKAYNIEGLVEGITLDQYNGDIQVDTRKSIQLTELKINLIVGSQTIYSEPFFVEVFDCSQAIKFTNDTKFVANLEYQSFNVIQQNSRLQQCGDYKMSIQSSSQAITKGAEKGQIIVDTTKEIEKASLSILIQVGEQYLSHQFPLINVFDCQKYVNIPNLSESYRFQINSNSSLIKANFVSTSEKCQQVSYSFTRQHDFIEIDPSNAMISVDTAKSFSPIYVQVMAKFGFQIIKSERFLVEVYDCASQITLPNLWKDHKSLANGLGIQLQRMLIIDARPKTKSQEFCPINSYKINGEAEGMTILQKKGTVKIDTNLVYSLIEIEVTVVAGSQTIVLPTINVKPFRTGAAKVNSGSSTMIIMYGLLVFAIIIFLGCFYYVFIHKKDPETPKRNKKYEVPPSGFTNSKRQDEEIFSQVTEANPRDEEANSIQPLELSTSRKRKQTSIHSQDENQSARKRKNR